MKEKWRLMIQISLKFVPKNLIYKKLCNFSGKGVAQHSQ